MSIRDIFPIDKWDFKRQTIFADLPAEELDVLMSRKLEHVYRKGEIIFREGAHPAGIFYIGKGKVKKYKADSEGREQIIYVANTGELLGYPAVLSGDTYPDSAAVLEESLIIFILKEDFLKAVNQSDLLNRRLLKALSHEFGVLANSLSLYGQKSVRERLALYLIVIREKYKVDFDPHIPVVIDMSREDLAAIVGTARENVVRLLSEFKEEGIVETRGRKIIVLDVLRLVKIANYQ